MQNQHSRMSPSSAERIINCPGSVKLCEKYGVDKTSKHAKQGTLAHHLAKVVLTSEPNAFYYTRHPLPPDEETEGLDVKVTEEMAQHVQDYVDYVVDIKNDMLTRFGKLLTLFAVEKRVASDLHSEAYGTSDNLTGAHFGPLHVVDFKYGVSPVNAAQNKQLMLYSSYAMRTYGDFDRVYLHIFQPRAKRKKKIDVWATTPRTVLSFEKYFVRVMKRAEKKGAPLKAGSWCFWCSAQPKCPKHKKRRIDRAKEAFL